MNPDSLSLRPLEKTAVPPPGSKTDSPFKSPGGNGCGSPSCNTALTASADAAKGHDQYLAVSTRERLFTVSQDCPLSKPADRYTLSYAATHDKNNNTGKAFPILYTAHRHPKNAPVCTSTLRDITCHALPLPVTAVTLIPDKKESGQIHFNASQNFAG